jgi:hypothetical protein
MLDFYENPKVFPCVTEPNSTAVINMLMDFWDKPRVLGVEDLPQDFLPAFSSLADAGTFFEMTDASVMFFELEDVI